MHIKSADNLPMEWDVLADNYFQQTPFLLHAEKFNPCKQRYYGGFENDVLICGAIVYTLRLDLLTFVNIKSPIQMHIVGIPCSVSSSGIFGDDKALQDLKKYISKIEKGFILFLNLINKPANKSFASGRTLPTIVLKNCHASWEEFVKSFRSPYRRRLNQINQENKDLIFKKMACKDFTDEMHRQYLTVYKRSSGKLEKLTFDFFKNLPPEFVLTACYIKHKLLGWNISLENRNIHYFFLGGIDYKQNKTYNTYLRLLTTIIKSGIENKAVLIELGQTAEIAKMRMGGKPVTLYMEACHSSVILNGLLKRLSGLLEYKPKLENTNALKDKV